MLRTLRSPKSAAAWIEARFPCILLAVGLVLLLGNLGNMYLWQDEAETALLSQRLGSYGLPLALDGRNLIRQAPKDVQYTADYVWVYHPWLPFYFTAFSFSMLGPTTFAARLPHALAGLATVLLFYHSTRRQFRDHRVAMLGATFLLFCIPFLLHARQCKYFPFAALFTVATLDAYLRLRQEQRPGSAFPYFILAGFCLFQSNFGAFVPLMAAIALHMLLSSLHSVPGALRSRPHWVELGRLALAMGILALFVLPWAIYLQTWARGRFVFDVYRFVGHLVHYSVYITGWVFPVILAILFAYFYLNKQNGFRLEANEASIVNLYGLVLLLTLLFLSATFIWQQFSYIVQLVPLLMLLLALTVVRVMDHSHPAGWALVLLLLATNVLHLFPYVLPISQQFKWASLAPRRYLAETDALIATAGDVRFDLANYSYELTHDYDDPDEGIALFLKDRAAPDDLVVANYGELPIAFYTGLGIAGGLSGYRLEFAEQARWVINGRYGPYQDEMRRILAQGNYEAITIPYPDLQWGNKPGPEYHKFATVRGVPPVVIYRRIN